MTTTVGISAERTVVRGVLLSHTPGKRSEILQAVEQRVEDGGSIVHALDALAAAADITDAAVAYHTAQDRQRIVSELASGQWRTSSLVSLRSALFALVADMPDLDEFGSVVMLNLADRTATAVVIGPDRQRVLASGTWPTEFADGTVVDGPVETFDTDVMTETIERVRSLLASIPAHPDAIVLCGAAAADSEIAGALRYELTARVVLVPDFAGATARGAALIAADQARTQSAGPPLARRRPKRLLVSAAAIAALLGVAGFAASQLLDDSSPAMTASSRDTTSVSPPSALSPPSTGLPTPLEATTGSPLPSAPAGSARAPARPETPAQANPADPSAATPAWPSTPPWSATAPTTAAPGEPAPPTWVPAPEAEPEPEAVPSDTPTPTKVGAPNPQGLFPGEAPPPAAGSDPAAEQAWWANHWNLKRQWMNGG